MKKTYHIVPCLIALCLSSCSTIYFDRGKASPSDLEYSEWHHDGIFQLVEFSAPLDLGDRCAGKEWESVKTQKSFLNGFVGAFTYNLYDPWTTSYSCK